MSFSTLVFPSEPREEVTAMTKLINILFKKKPATQDKGLFDDQLLDRNREDIFVALYLSNVLR